MAAYSKRHYGEREWRLTDPEVIVLHFTGSGSYSSVWNTFDSNAPNLGESPGVCSHYVIEQDGTIDELVAPRIRCRHTIGLNHTSIGIEMVQSTGSSSHWADQQILDRGPQIRSALRLVRWLQARYGIPTGEVIGHAMANDDPYFKDLQGWTNDHTDWLKRDVREFRKRLRR
jgi:N-acetyl-anhydromuramyl-L-alanine amidase AmpD